MICYQIAQKCSGSSAAHQGVADLAARVRPVRVRLAARFEALDLLWIASVYIPA